MVSSRLSVKRGSTAIALCAWALGCGSSAPATGESAAGGAGSGGMGAGAGGALAGSAGATSAGQAGSTNGGATENGGSGGASVSAGSGGASGSGTQTCPTMGTQADPGTDGDGKATLDAPYAPAPETLMHSNGAPVGKVNGMAVGSTTLTPLIYAAKEAYPGQNQMLKYEYWIYVPAQYEPGCSAAFMVFQDGLHFVGIDDAKLNAPTVLDNLIASG